MKCEILNQVQNDELMLTDAIRPANSLTYTPGRNVSCRLQGKKKIPLNLPFSKGDFNVPSLEKGGLGRIYLCLRDY